jgi:hypothetical protein
VSERRKLKFACTEEAAAEAERLRKGYRKLGEWSLPQMCRHLALAIRYSMQPAPERKDTQTLAQWLLLKIILLFKRIPSGQANSKRITPPDEVPDSAIDEFKDAMKEMDEFKGEFSPHPRLGKIKHKDYVKLHLIHCAHHFGFLIPTS